MISIIVCSNNKELFTSFNVNIEQTIGMPYEIILIDDAHLFGLAEAYNRGAKKAKYNILCFVHHDIIFEKRNWGHKLINYLDNGKTGVIGVAGGIYKSEFGMDWTDGYVSFLRASVMTDGPVFFYNPLNETKSQVLCLDGLFLACKKNIWNQFMFDERFKGFHFYDTDWSFQISRYYKNYVVYDLNIKHLSLGNRDKVFLNNSFVFQEKWHSQLPDSLLNLTSKEIANIEGYVLGAKLDLMRKHGIGRKRRLKLLLYYFIKYKNVYHLIRSSLLLR